MKALPAKHILIILCAVVLGVLTACSSGNVPETEPETETPAASAFHDALQPLRSGLTPEEITPGFIATLEAAETYDRIMIAAMPEPESTEGTFYYFERTDAGWEEILREVTYIGSEGVGDADFYHEITPAGIFPFIELFGIMPDPGCIMPYHELTGTEYWCAEEYYNRFVDERYTDHSACSKEDDEFLAEIDCYQYAAAFDYNPECIVDEGCAFFLHCYDVNPWTEGCVSVPEETMRYLMTRIDERTCIIIDIEENIRNY